MFEAGRHGEQPEASAIFVSTAVAEPRSRGVAFFLSLALHVLAVTTAVNVDLGPPKSFQVRLPEQLIAESQDRVLWYPPERDLPEVAPVKPTAPAAPDARARFRMPQTIVANDPNPDSDRQMILGPWPDIKIEQDIPSPNLLGWSAPRVSPLRFQMSEAAEQQPQQQTLSETAAPAIQPAKPLPDASQPEIRLRYRAAAPAPAVPEQKSLASESAPKVSATPAPLGVDVAQFQKLDPLRYRLQEQKQQDPARATLPVAAAPQVAAAGPAGLDAAAFSKTARLRYWMPEGQSGKGPAQSTLSENAAPEVSAKLPAGTSLAAADPKIQLRYRSSENLAGGTAAAPPSSALAEQFGSAPGVESGRAPAESAWLTETVRSLARVEAPRAPNGAGDSQASSSGQPSGLSANGEQQNLAVVGVNPDPNAPARVPEGQRRGRFAASPDGGPGGGDQIAGPTETASVRMPNLSIAGPAAPPVGGAIRAIPGAAAALARREPAEGDLLSSLRNPRDYARMPMPPPGAAPATPDEPSQALQNKAVYTLAVNMPNITSAAGSWVIRFAELGAKEREDAIAAGQKNLKPARSEPVSAPSPRVKVDPKYIRSAADEGIEGKVVLYAVIGQDGVVRQVRIMRSLDARLDESAVEAFSKWKFDPATSAGLPVDVEAVVEIPFQLAPLEPTPKKFRY